jgi:hypothetical protein
MTRTKSSDINWSSCSLEDLESIRDEAVKLIAQRELESKSISESIIRCQIKDIETEYYSLTDDWSSVLCDPISKDLVVNEVECLDLDRIADSIKSIIDNNANADVNVNVDQQWILASEFSNLVCSMIQDANDTIGQLVDGSGGRWCPETAHLLESFWKDLVKLTIGRDTRPSEKVIDTALKSISLDDYSQLNMEKLFECLKP